MDLNNQTPESTIKLSQIWKWHKLKTSSFISRKDEQNSGSTQKSALKPVKDFNMLRNDILFAFQHMLVTYFDENEKLVMNKTNLLSFKREMEIGLFPQLKEIIPIFSKMGNQVKKNHDESFKMEGLKMHVNATHLHSHSIEQISKEMVENEEKEEEDSKNPHIKPDLTEERKTPSVCMIIGAGKT